MDVTQSFVREILLAAYVEYSVDVELLVIGSAGAFSSQWRLWFWMTRQPKPLRSFPSSVILHRELPLIVRDARPIKVAHLLL